MDDAEGFSAVFMKLTEGAVFVLLSFARRLVGAATMGEARADGEAVAPYLLDCFARPCPGTWTCTPFCTIGFPPVVDNFLRFVPRSASVIPFTIAAVAVWAWPLPIDAEAPRPLLKVFGAVASLLIALVLVDARVASVRVDGAGSIVGLPPADKDSELPMTVNRS